MWPWVCENFLYVLDAARDLAARAADTALARRSRLTLTCRTSRQPVGWRVQRNIRAAS
jgi:hypothetical protein